MEQEASERRRSLISLAYAFEQAWRARHAHEMLRDTARYDAPAAKADDAR